MAVDTVSELEEMFTTLLGCCLHSPAWMPSDVASEIVWEGDRQTGSESSSIVVVQLKGQPPAYGLLTQGEDYTGHGCQCGSFTAREDSISKLLGHLDNYDLIRLLTRQVGAQD